MVYGVVRKRKGYSGLCIQKGVEQERDTLSNQMELSCTAYVCNMQYTQDQQEAGSHHVFS